MKMTDIEITVLHNQRNSDSSCAICCFAVEYSFYAEIVKFLDINLQTNVLYQFRMCESNDGGIVEFC